MVSRVPCRLWLCLVLAACTAPQERRAAPRSAIRVIPPVARPAAKPAKPAWQARRVIADAATVAGGRLHIVKSGETGIAIARAYGAAWSKVAAANGLTPPYTLEVGDRLLLPSTAQVAAMSVEDRAKAFNLDIDDIITGGEPAATRPSPSPRPPLPRPLSPATGVPSSPPLPMLAGNTPQFRWPVDGRILSSFGAKPGGRFNDGVNLKASAGAPVRAAGNGVIAYAGDAIPGFGNLVLIKHAGGWVTAYAHNEALLTTRGKRVAQGDVIARAGSTGSVDEPQLHFEIRRGRSPVDPTRVIGGR